MPEVFRRFPERPTGKDTRRMLNILRHFLVLCKCKITPKELNKISTVHAIKPARILP